MQHRYKELLAVNSYKHKKLTIMQKFKLNDKVTVCEKPKCGAYGNCEGIIIQIANYKVSVGNIETLVSIKSKSINRPIGPFRFNELTKIEA